MRGGNSLEKLLREGEEILNDLFECGLESVLDETMRRIELISEECENRGLHQGAEDFRQLESLLRKKTHVMNFDLEPVIHIMRRISRYISLCKEHVTYDNAIMHMKGAEE